MRYFSLLLVVLLSASQLSATTYYLDYDGGSNSNDGLSPATAWKDLFKIRNALIKMSLISISKFIKQNEFHIIIDFTIKFFMRTLHPSHSEWPHEDVQSGNVHFLKLLYQMV